MIGYFMNVFSDFKPRLKERIAEQKPSKIRMKRRKLSGKVDYEVA